METKEDILSFHDVNWGKTCRLELAGVSYCTPDYHIRRNPCPLFVFEYVVSGSGTLIVNGEISHPAAGDVYIAPGWHSQEYFPDKNEPWVKHWFNISGPLPEMLLKLYGLDGKYLFHNAPEAGMLILSGINELRTMPREKIPAFMEETCFRMIRLLARSIVPDVPSDRDRVERLSSWLRSRTTKKMPFLSEAAAVFGCSPVHTIRLFKQATGYSPIQFLMNEKMDLAGNLLRNTQKPLKEIAELVGFSDVFYFSRQFSKRFKVSPAAFRKKSI